MLQIGKTLYVGSSTRTNPAGIAALAEIVQPHGYRVVPVPVHGSLHLKTACTALDETTLLANPQWIDITALNGLRILSIPEAEPWGANVLRIGERIWAQTGLPAHPGDATQAGIYRSGDRLQRIFESRSRADLPEPGVSGLICLEFRSIVLRTQPVGEAHADSPRSNLAQVAAIHVDGPDLARPAAVGDKGDL